MAYALGQLALPYVYVGSRVLYGQPKLKLSVADCAPRVPRISTYTLYQNWKANIETNFGSQRGRINGYVLSLFGRGGTTVNDA